MKYFVGQKTWQRCRKECLRKCLSTRILFKAAEETTRKGDTAKGETVKRRKEPDYCKWENSDSAAKQGPGSA